MQMHHQLTAGSTASPSSGASTIHPAKCAERTSKGSDGLRRARVHEAGVAGVDHCLARAPQPIAPSGTATHQRLLLDSVAYVGSHRRGYF